MRVRYYIAHGGHSGVIRDVGKHIRKAQADRGMMVGTEIQSMHLMVYQVTFIFIFTAIWYARPVSESSH